MRRMRRPTIVAALVLAMLAGAAAYASRSHPTGGLDAVAESAWRAHNEYLVTGVARAEPAYAAWLASRRADLDARRAGLRESAIAYVAQDTRLLKVEDTFARRDRARLKVRIETRLDMRGPEGAPPSTWAGEELEFHFRWVDGGWVLHHVVSLGHG